MPPWVLLILTAALYGVWAVAMKIVGDHVPLPWAALVSLCLYLPMDLYLLSRISRPHPSPTHLAWTAILVLSSIGASLAYLKAARHFPGPVLTAAVAMYPVVALPVFALLGDKPSWKQALGVLCCALGSWLVL